MRIAKALLVLLVAAAATFTTSASAQVGREELWVAQQDTDAIAVIRHGRVRDRIPLPKGTGPHSIDVSPSGAFAYVSGVGNGDLHVVDTKSRKIVTTLDLGDKGTHQARPTPDGRRILVAQMQSKQVIALVASEAGRRWTKEGALTLEKEPICTAYADGGRRAYVSTKPDGIAVVDTTTMTVTKELPTDGAVQCGLAELADSRTIYVSSNGGTGHLYRLDPGTDELADAGLSLDAKDLHGLALSPEGDSAYLSARESDALKVVPLGGGAIRTVSLDRRPNEVDKPDQVRLSGETVAVSMRTTGEVALVDRRTLAVRYVPVAPASANAVHGIAAVSAAAPSLPRTGGGGTWAAVVAMAAAMAVRRRLANG
ncbi:MAG TPA: hypothetical protein VNB94_01330 [Mycobacteriales bacterium]|nr:hypothetical protein [Mycobacteriales bacterium]